MVRYSRAKPPKRQPLAYQMAVFYGYHHLDYGCISIRRYAMIVS